MNNINFRIHINHDTWSLLYIYMIIAIACYLRGSQDIDHWPGTPPGVIRCPIAGAGPGLTITELKARMEEY